MKNLKIDPLNPDPEIIAQAAQVIRGGGIIIYPTDTCYGIGGDATSEIVTQNVQRLKGRAAHNPFSVIVRDFKMIQDFAIMSEQAETIMHEYLPGRYTFALLNKNLTNWPYNSIWVRMPKYLITQMLADRLSVPYITTSANITGEPPAYSIEELDKSLLSAERLTVVPDLILDVGPIPHNSPSTIVNLTNWPPKIIRQGDAEFIWKN